MSAIIQLGFDERDNKLWWVDAWLWDDDTIASVQRPTEAAAFRNMFRQSKLLQKRGIYINLSNLHIRVMQLEYKALTRTPVPDNVNEWISQQLRYVSTLKVTAILDECELVTCIREAFGMPPLVIDWEPAQRGSRAA